jgi:hypothetical protein
MSFLYDIFDKLKKIWILKWTFGLFLESIGWLTAGKFPEREKK